MQKLCLTLAFAGLCLPWLGPSASGQSIQPIYSFTNGPANPQAGLTLGPDGNFYGTTYGGGSSGVGTVFQVTTNGTVTALVNFNGTNGIRPEAGLALGPDGNLYGTTVQGGSSYSGTVFRVTTNGTMTTLVNFNNTNGAEPEASLALGPDGNFYGTTADGGGSGDGTLFQVTTNGTLTTLYSFSAESGPNYTNSDGANPYASLTLGPDGNFYGTTYDGGGSGNGTVFRVTTNGTMTTLVNFNNTNGAEPLASLTLGPDGNFYGTTFVGGGVGDGTVFRVTTNGAMTTLVNFNGANGADPVASLALGSDGNFYGTTTYGGSSGYGTMFRVTTNGTLTTLVNFNGTNGAEPEASLALGPDGNFYGTTYSGGSGGGLYVGGTVFRVTTNGTMTILFNLSGENSGYSQASLALGSDGNFYGTTEYGGSGADGNVFRVTTNGTMTTLVNFNGATPYAGLALGPDGNFYGTTGGEYDSSYDGTVFRVTTNGTLTTLVNFNGTNGANPYTSLALGSDGNFYGTTSIGGSSDSGTVFRMTTNGTLTTLVNFNGTNGASPYASLALGPDGNFYGTTSAGGSSNDGTVFRVTTNGTMTTLVNFNGTNGAEPEASLALGPDGNFYGTTYTDYGSGNGTVFQVTTNGTLTTLVDFNGTNGAEPEAASLALGPDGNFYGTTFVGGGVGDGTVFRMTTNGTLTTLVSFAVTNGAYPDAGLTLGPDGNFYGTTSEGGSGNGGVIYRLNLPPEITSQPANLSVYAGYSAVFSASVFGTAPYSYQWLSDGLPISGATNGTLSIPKVSSANQGSYQVVVSNSFGSVTSSPASLTVLPLPPFGARVFLDTFDPTITWGLPDYFGGDSTNGSDSVVSGIGVSNTAALRIQSSFNNGPYGYGYFAGGWQNGNVSGNVDLNLSHYVLSFDAMVTGDAAHQAGGAFALQIQEGAGTYFSEPFPQGILLTYQPYQGGADLMVPQTGVWKHFAINLGGPQFQWPNGTNETFNPTGATWQIYFQVNAADWGAEPQTNSTLVIDNLALNMIVDPAPTLAPVQNGDGSVTLSFGTSTNISSRVYAATNLTPPVFWQPIYTNMNGGAWQFTDSNAGAYRARFYRLSTP